MRTASGRYARNTRVPEAQSKTEIERTLQRYGADQFVSGWEADGDAKLGFRAHGRHVMFQLPLKDCDDRERRRRWRCLLLLVKAKLTAVEDEITSFESEFLAHIVTPGGRTVGDHVLPKLDEWLSHGKIPALMGGFDK